MTVTHLAWDTDPVPRRGRAIGPDELAAERVRYEREKAGLSQGELARLVTEAGAPMQQQAIWKIESGDPPRRISFGEAVAFSKVFGIEDVADLGRPRDKVLSDDLQRLIAEFRQWNQTGLSLFTTLATLLGRAGYLLSREDLRDVLLSTPEIRDNIPELRTQVEEAGRLLAELGAAVARQHRDEGSAS